jgi:hypothetical protein
LSVQVFLVILKLEWRKVATEVRFCQHGFAPRGELGPQGSTLSPVGNVHPFVYPWGEHYLLFRNGGANRGSSPLVDNFTRRGQSSLLGDNSPLGSKFAARDEINNRASDF